MFTGFTVLKPENDPENIFKLKLKERSKVKSSHTMMLHTYTAQPMSLPSISFLRLTVSEIQPGQTFLPT